MALTFPGVTTLALLAGVAVAATALHATPADAAPKKRAQYTGHTYDGAPRRAENYSYQRGRTRVYVTRRSCSRRTKCGPASASSPTTPFRRATITAAPSTRAT